MVVWLMRKGAVGDDGRQVVGLLDARQGRALSEVGQRCRRVLQSRIYLR